MTGLPDVLNSQLLRHSLEVRHEAAAKFVKVENQPADSIIVGGKV